jgi:hypothetical protein
MKRRVLRFVIAAVVFIAAAIAMSRIDRHELVHTIAAASGVPLLLAVFLNIIVRTAVRARRTELLLGGRVSFLEVVRLNLAGYAAAAVLPGPADDVLVSSQLVRRNGMTWKELLKYQATDKALSITSVAAMALGLLPAPLAVAIGAAGIAALAIARPRLLVPFGWLVISNLLVIAMIGLALGAVGAAVSARTCLEIFCATSIAALIPVPGQVGTLESAFVLAAVHHGVAAPVALAAAVLYHVGQLAPAIAGLPLLASLSWEKRTCQ